MKNDKEQTIDWAILHYDRWQLYVARTEKGLCYVGSPGQTYGELESWLQKRFPNARLFENLHVFLIRHPGFTGGPAKDARRNYSV